MRRKQNENVALASLAAGFCSDIQTGFYVNSLSDGKPIKSDKVYYELVGGKLKETNFLHKIEDKKTNIIFINREMEIPGVAYGNKTYSPGGVHKEHLITVKLLLSTDSGYKGIKDGKKDVLKYRTMKVFNKKNKVSVPFRMCELRVFPDGTMIKSEKKSKEVFGENFKDDEE